MNSSLQQKLYDKYPKIFAQKDLDKSQTLMCWGITVGDGWFNILDTLCSQIQLHIDTPRENLERYQKYLQASMDRGNEEDIKYWANKLEEVKQLIEDRPQVEAVQVKEKYGTLRFYTNHYDDCVNTMINFAEEMSACTCEQCGSPGTPTTGGWIKVQCSNCRGEI